MTKQQALDRLNFMRVWYEDSGTPDADYDAICYAIGVIEAQPAELETLIKALEAEHKKLREMQKAQPEIIYCQNCKFYQSNFHWCKLLDSEFSLTDFCSYGERGTNERAD